MRPRRHGCLAASDPAGFIAVEDEKTLLVPDRRGNNRIDSLRNILTNPHVALLFLIPGCETLRVNGRAYILTAPQLPRTLHHPGDKLPRSVIVVEVDTVFFQCSKVIVRSKLWDPSIQVERSTLADRRENPRRDQRRQNGRRRARPPRARAHEGDDLLSWHCRCRLASRAADSGVVRLVPPARLQPLLHVRRHRRRDLDRRLVLVERHHDLARVQMQARAAVARRAAVDVVAEDRKARSRAQCTRN